MEALKSIFHVYHLEITALVMTLPRLYAFFAVSQLLSPTAVPRLARNGAILMLALPLLPVNMPHATAFNLSVASFGLHLAKEFVLGGLLGYLLGWLFWSVQSAGALIDNQRGAAIASSIDPLQGHESSPLGNLFSQALLTYFFTTGSVLALIGILYRSYVIWPISALVPVISESFPALMLGVFDNSMRLMFVIAGPIVIVMFIAEFALAMVSRFAPQIQVFILAMPIKSLLAIFMLIFYFATLLPFAVKQDGQIAAYVDRLYSNLREGEAIELPPHQPREIP
jgi:type III secretion protein T